MTDEPKSLWSLRRWYRTQWGRRCRQLCSTKCRRSNGVFFRTYWSFRPRPSWTGNIVRWTPNQGGLSSEWYPTTCCRGSAPLYNGTRVPCGQAHGGFHQGPEGASFMYQREVWPRYPAIPLYHAGSQTHRSEDPNLQRCPWMRGWRTPRVQMGAGSEPELSQRSVLVTSRDAQLGSSTGFFYVDQKMLFLFSF